MEDVIHRSSGCAWSKDDFSLPIVPESAGASSGIQPAIQNKFQIYSFLHQHISCKKGFPYRLIPLHLQYAHLFYQGTLFFWTPPHVSYSHFLFSFEDCNGKERWQIMVITATCFFSKECHRHLRHFKQLYRWVWSTGWQSWLNKYRVDQNMHSHFKPVSVLYWVSRISLKLALGLLQFVLS